MCIHTLMLRLYTSWNGLSFDYNSCIYCTYSYKKERENHLDGNCMMHQCIFKHTLTWSLGLPQMRWYLMGGCDYRALGVTRSSNYRNIIEWKNVNAVWIFISRIFLLKFGFKMLIKYAVLLMKLIALMGW